MRSPLTSVPERGLVEVSRGKGTFGTQPKITQEPTETTGFVEEKLRSAPSHGNGPTNTLSIYRKEKHDVPRQSTGRSRCSRRAHYNSNAMGRR
jgi:DNA-binding GntR family transcriptional regulator